MTPRCLFVFAAPLTVCLTGIAVAADPQVIHLWPGKPPGESKELPPEENITKPDDKPVGDRPIIKLTNVSTPTLSVYRPSTDRDTGLAIIVCPGGGHRILAFDHEGTEVAEWLNTLGVTALVLKYRVPARNPDKRWEGAVQDAQRAIGLVRSRAKEWNVDPQKIGILGFSAGGDTAARAALLHAQRQYDAVDAVDQVSSRPDFAVLIYPGGLDDKTTPWKLKDDVQVDKTSPPMFFAHAADDNVPASQSVLLFSELRKAGISAELHVYATGGHGYGMRQTGHPVNTWPQRCEDWLRNPGVADWQDIAIRVIEATFHDTACGPDSRVRDFDPDCLVCIGIPGTSLAETTRGITCDSDVVWSCLRCGMSADVECQCVVWIRD
jgi:acetyl esterase/lipase